MKRVGEQVREQLQQAGGVAGGVAVPVARDGDLPLRRRRAELVGGPIDQLGDVEAPAAADEPQTAPQSGAGEVEELLDHVLHSPGRRNHPPQGAQLSLVGQTSFQKLCAGHDRVQRIAQVVPQDPHEHLVHPQIAGQLDLLLVELKEDVGLALQHARIDRLEEEVDGARLVALEDALGVLRAGGEEDDRDVLGALHPPHQLGQLEAVHLGHLDVEDGQRHLVNEQQLERLRARARLEDLQPVSAQERLERHQVLVGVVDQQEFHGLSGHWDSLCAPVATRPSNAARSVSDRTWSASTIERAARGISGAVAPSGV